MKRYYDRIARRLVYIGQGSDPDAWDDRWKREDLRTLFDRTSRSMESGMIVDITRKYLPGPATIIEGGCGLGDKVFVLKQAGYEVVGIDWAARTVGTLNAYMPELDVRCGDLRALDFPDGSFDGYWSFGVIEHGYDGFERIASEMLRVLKPGGCLFMTVPALSRLRRMKAAAGMYPRFDEGAVDISAFYQYAYSPEEIEGRFCAYGFSYVEKVGWSVYKGVRDEIPGTHLLMSLLFRYCARPVWRVLKDSCNHSYLYVFRKAPSHPDN